MIVQPVTGWRPYTHLVCTTDAHGETRHYLALFDPAPATLADLRATSAALDAADMDPVERAWRSARIARTAVAVAFT